MKFENNPLSFTTVKQLFDKIDAEMDAFSGPAWHSTEIQLGDAPKDTHVMYYRDVSVCGDYLLGRPVFRGKITCAPVQMKGADDKTDEYDEVCSGTAWNEHQVCACGNMCISH